MITGKREINIIQGDYYQKNVIIQNVDPSLIDTVNITCKALNVNKDLVYDSENQKYIFYLTPTETANFKVALTSYDLTITFADSKRKTVCYNAMFRVMAKNNIIEE